MYKIDLAKIGLDEYITILSEKTLIPSRQILKESLSERIEFFINMHLPNIKKLQKYLKKKGSIESLSNNEIFSEEYLKQLLREINTLEKKAIKLREFVWLPKELIAKLEGNNIKTTEALYDLVLTDGIDSLASRYDLDLKELTKLYQLANLTRIQWVNHTFAYILYLTGYRFPKDIAGGEAEEIYEKITKYNKEYKVYKGNIGRNDIKILIECAQFLLKYSDENKNFNL